MIRQFELVEKVKSYDPDADEDAINRAYVYAMKKHGSQTRASGDPYFSHPLEVAYILTGLKLDTASIITALLHDTVEDTDATLEEIEKLFGSEIRNLVDGVTKLGKLETKSENTKQAENFRKLLLAMSEDIRVLLVKLSDRLHNMRTLHHIKKEEKRQRIAHETLEIYAVLAERIGMRQVKEELQDLAFAELRTEERNSIVNRLNFLREQGKAETEKTMEEITKVLRESGIEKFEITGREKRPFSIWKKMAQKSLNFEQLSDIIAFRVLVGSVPDCYHALGAVHAKWHMIPDEFDDYISTPKSNGYRSLHTAVIGPLQHRIEVQIRTQEMHDIAENGVAAHWSYKQSAQNVRTEGKQFRWMRELLEILERTTSPEDFLENTKLEMYQDQVFCFSPKGDLIALPRAATPVDFGYAVHSRIGDTCVGAKVNGRIVPLRTHLHNGDQVEIITSKSQTPSPAWERFVVTGKARSAIRKYVRTQQRKEYTVLGKAMVQKLFKQEGFDLNEKTLEGELDHFNKKNLEDFYAEVGEGLISRQHVSDRLFPKKKSAADAIREKFFRRKSTNVSGLKREAVPIRGLIPGMAMNFAGCCHPIPGDHIGGVVTTGKGVTIHTDDCDKFMDIETNEPERILDVSWDSSVDEGKEAYVGRVKAIVAHETGGLATLANAIAKDAGNITNIKIVNRASDFFEMLIDIEVHDVDHLNNIIANLRSQPIIQTIDRYS
ncbi:MAG: bifunctional (p)ppGpp synthetase/guanosine-3',5'-bis(diphosphate) 3'-pyrophosphohydrolase [Alphaproteobacteria bacterium]|nr:bifunctional (p)ppGpp synthetase/guanosine-3',5'-bis(diphosphate) 3'-pyrophosphohydrolase [Alphaproteobacteria bacterium]